MSTWWAQGAAPADSSVAGGAAAAASEALCWVRGGHAEIQQMSRMPMTEVGTMHQGRAGRRVATLPGL